jgi:hypothetical protein
MRSAGGVSNKRINSTWAINQRWLTKMGDFAGIWRHLRLRAVQVLGDY